MNNIRFAHNQPAQRRGKSLLTLHMVDYCIKTGRSMAIGTSDVDALYDRLRQQFPGVDLSKDHAKSFVVVNPNPRQPMKDVTPKRKLLK